MADLSSASSVREAEKGQAVATTAAIRAQEEEERTGYEEMGSPEQQGNELDQLDSEELEGGWELVAICLSLPSLIAAEGALAQIQDSLCMNLYISLKTHQAQAKAKARGNLHSQIMVHYGEVELQCRSVFGWRRGIERRGAGVSDPLLWQEDRDSDMAV